jgi:hypothetical protein
VDGPKVTGGIRGVNVNGIEGGESSMVGDGEEESTSGETLSPDTEEPSGGGGDGTAAEFDTAALAPAAFVSPTAGVA